MDLEDVEYVLSTMKLLGSKGTTGTQASFMELFDGDEEKVKKLDRLIAEKMGFESCFPVSGQTYSRKLDTRVLNVLAGIAASAHKFSNDIRLLQHLKEIEELQTQKGHLHRYSYGWFKTLLRLEILTSNTDNIRSREVNISFGRIELILLSDFSFRKSIIFSFKELFFTGKIRFKNSLKFKL